MNRTVTRTRTTKETDITVTLNLDGTGKTEIDTGIGFFDHMLNGFARHGLFDLTVHAKGDLEVDSHHTIEDTGIVLGQAILEAIGDKAGIKRYGHFMLPMDETLALCAAYKRNIYEKAGGFCKKTIFNEDMILAGHMINAGYKVAYVAEARVIHSHNYTGMQQFHRNFDMAVSQAEHPEVFDGIKSENEGIKLVKQTAAHLVKQRKIYMVPKLVYQSGCKYIGYRMGKMYKKLPDKVVKWCSMSPGYWEK